MEHSGMVHHTWNSSYIALSFLIAALASYISLELAGRAGRNLRNAANRFWLVAQALVLGYGIWAMHFVGMLAFEVKAAVGFNSGLTALSGLAAVLFMYPALLIVHSGAFNLRRLAVAGTVAGTGIAVMHYLGMYGFRVPGTTVEVVWLPLIGSLLIAVGASTAALFLFHRLSGAWRTQQGRLKTVGLQALASVVMGVAIISMHYTGMAALKYRVADELALGSAAAGADTSLLGLVVSVVSFLLLGLAVTSIFMDAGRGGDLDELDFDTAATGAAAD
ncbi:MHYT domain-containing protein [Deinococcus aquaedulcis]|uniref:MHYT domain-containing protein n=1 Tax=Deinococcus aquaedulcis TaxID=2840455 RepID=UPI001C83043F|nr:MHYT domain-containing protein [Deinococcus aquaedulcis]